MILDALMDPATADSWFREPLPQVEGWFRFILLEAAIGRTGGFGELLPAALALVPFANDYTVERDWGPLLVKAFPDGGTTGGGMTDAQRRFLSAIADNDACWGNIANKRLWLRRAGLPEERADIRALLSPTY